MPNPAHAHQPWTPQQAAALASIAAGDITAEQGLSQLKKFYPLVEVLRGLAFGVATAVSLSV